MSGRIKNRCPAVGENRLARKPRESCVRLGRTLPVSFFVRSSHVMVTPMNTARCQATYEDLLKVPDILIAEIVDGELITSPRPASPHARAASVIRGDIDPFDRRPGESGRPGGWWILFEPELHLGPDILVPDLA